MTLFPELYLAFATLPTVKGVSTVDLLTLPEMVGQVLSGIMRKRGTTPKEFAIEIASSEAEAQHLLDTLVKKGYLCKEFSIESDENRYCVNLVKFHGRSMSTSTLNINKE